MRINCILLLTAAGLLGVGMTTRTDAQQPEIATPSYTRDGRRAHPLQALRQLPSSR